VTTTPDARKIEAVRSAFPVTLLTAFYRTGERLSENSVARGTKMPVSEDGGGRKAERIAGGEWVRAYLLGAMPVSSEPSEFRIASASSSSVTIRTELLPPSN
jgi:hypothetical protein